jgi:GNAT superfamily N-acetyltransferase
MELLVRPAEPDDAPALSSLLFQIGWDMPSAQVEDELLSAQPGMDALVAENEGGVVGLVVSNTRRQFHRGGEVTTIDALVVDQRVRARGVGKHLVCAIIECARERGTLVVDTTIRTDRLDAYQFYAELGFVPVGSHFVASL